LLTLSLMSCETGENEGSVDTNLVQNSASREGKSDTDLPEITFETKEHDFGRITQGERVRYEFAFTNTGRSNLIISDARGSCGCTVPDWPKKPVLPGEKGVIKVEFNSEGKSGLQEKTITIVTNCEPATRVIRIKANIVVAETANY
jgi:hypothetical protein